MKLADILLEKKEKKQFESRMLEDIFQIIRDVTGIEDCCAQSEQYPNQYQGYARDGHQGMFVSIQVMKNKIQLNTKWLSDKESFPGYEEFPNIRLVPNGWWGQPSMRIHIGENDLDLAHRFIVEAFKNFETAPSARVRKTDRVRRQDLRKVVLQQISKYYQSLGGKDFLSPQAVLSLRANRDKMVENILDQNPSPEEVWNLVAQEFENIIEMSP